MKITSTNEETPALLETELATGIPFPGSVETEADVALREADKKWQLAKTELSKVKSRRWNQIKVV